MTAAPDQRPDDALIREARAVVQDRPTSHYTAYILTRLANALEQRGAELAACTTSGVAADDALYRGNSVRYWYDKAHAYKDAAGKLQAAEADVQRYATLKRDPIGARHLLHLLAQGKGDASAFDSMIDRIKVSYDAALRPSSEGER